MCVAKTVIKTKQNKTKLATPGEIVTLAGRKNLGPFATLQQLHKPTSAAPKNFPTGEKIRCICIPWDTPMLPVTDVPSSPSCTEAHGTSRHGLHRPAASNSPSAAATKSSNFKLAPRPNRLSYSAALRTAASHTSSAPATRRTASGSATIAPSTPTSGFVGKVRRRQTKANRRFSLELEVVQGPPSVLRQFQVD